MRDFLRRYVAYNFGLKLLSLALAVGLWLGLAKDPVTEIALDIPIEFHGLPDNMVVSSPDVYQAHIWLRGPERLIHRLSPSDVHAEMSVSAIRPGQHIFDLSAQNIHEPTGIEVVQVVPSQFHLEFDERVSRRVPVQPRVVGAPAPGYQLSRVVTVPETVAISGPKKHVEAVEAATTDPIDITGTMDHASFGRHAFVGDPLIQVLESDPLRITVMMERVPAAGATTQTQHP
jgi:hypothetical protein